MIENHEITFVIQGPVSSYEGRNQNNSVTRQLIESIRKFYPESFIILSTWNNQNDLDQYEKIVDIIIKSEDPGPIGTKQSWFSNINRQIVSTRNGLEKSTTKYSAKIRSDFFFNQYFDFKQYFSQKNVFNDSLDLFKDRILMCTYKGHYPLFPYYISDWFHLGLTNDLFDLWDIPLATDTDAEYYSDSEGYSFFKIPFSFTTEKVNSRLHSEQYIFTTFLKKKGGDFNLGYKDFGLKDFIKSYKLIRGNFQFVSRYNLGLRSYKYEVKQDSEDLIFWEFNLNNITLLKVLKNTIIIVMKSYYVYLFKKK